MLKGLFSCKRYYLDHSGYSFILNVFDDCIKEKYEQGGIYFPPKHLLT